MNQPVPASSVQPGAPSASPSKSGPVMAVLIGISVSHMLNDLMQSLLPAVYPILKANYNLSFTEIGIIAMVFHIVASFLQPLIGLYTDKVPKPYSLPIGMGFTFFGLLLLSVASNYPLILIAAAMVGMGSAVFHPDSSRVARMASGGRPGFAQSFFQVGGNLGTAIGPLLAALIVVPFGQPSLAFFSLAAFTAIIILSAVGRWYANRLKNPPVKRKVAAEVSPEARRRVLFGIGVLLLLIVSKHTYMSSLQSYYTFYLIGKFGLSTQSAQLLLFVFLGAVALGTFFGGPIGDKIGRKSVIWFSILGVLPFTLALPYVGLVPTVILTIIIGLVLASAFPAIIVFGQELMPNKVGTVAGFFFGFAFGVAGIAAAILGRVADAMGIDFVYQVCAFLPAIGLMAFFLPDPHREKNVKG